jgi:hypothetical protein
MRNNLKPMVRSAARIKLARDDDRACSADQFACSRSVKLQK